ncbi:RAD51-associated protein 2 [Sorex fumeus]|uniref:RAD51-associated protein 2 n=1 Tax=Sorex fumeus TaxID=62283 RepID=UPI0024AE21EF|nr:RAD51-associated protein 2 [Sorex fumeus]
MSLSNPSSWVAAELRKHASPLSPPAGPVFQPPRKRLRLEEPGAVPEAGWRLPLVPRLSEVEKAWELTPCRPLTELFLSADVLFGNATESSGGTSVAGAPRCEVGRRESRRQGSPRWRSLPTRGFGPVRASRRFSEAGDEFRAPSSVRSEAGGRQPLPNAPLTRALLEVKGGKGSAAQERDTSQKVRRCLKRTPSPLLDVPFCKKTQAESREIRNRCQAGRVTPSNNENNTSVFPLKIAKRPNLPSVEIAKPGYFGDSSPISIIPEFPTDLNSRMSSVYLEEMARKKNDINEAYVRGFTNIYWSQNRPDAKQKLQDDNKSVAAENIFPKCYESNPQSLSNQNTCVRKKDLISLNYYNQSRFNSDTRHPGKKVTIILENENWEELVTYLDCYMFTTMLKNFQTLETGDYNTRSIFIKNRENCIMNNYGAKYQNMKKTGENFGFLQLLEVDPLSTDYYNVKVVKTYEEQPKSLMIGMQSSQKTLILYFWLNGKEENDNMVQLRYNTTQKDFYLSSIFESFITEIFCFYKSILGIQNNNNILTWYEFLTCKKQVGVQNLVTRNMNVNRRHSIFELCLQTNVSERLKFILKTNIDSLLNNTDISTVAESDSKLGQAYISKWIVHLNYPKNVVESHTIYLERILMFSKLLEDTLKPMLEKRKLFKSENVFEKSNDKKFDSSSMTTEIIHFPVFETYKKFPLLMNFNDNMNGMCLTKEIAYNNNSCPEQLMFLGNGPHCITNAVKTYVQFDSQSIQHVNENCYEINMYSQDLAIERKHESNKMSSFTFKCMSDDNFNIRQQAIPKDQDINFREEINLTPITQIVHFGNLLSENEGKEYNLILKEEEKVTALLVQQDSKIGKEEKNASSSMSGMFPVQSVLLMNKKVCKEETNRYIDQNNVTDDNEYESILQESELANPKHFYPKNDSTESENYQFDLNVANKECFQDLTAKCLSTEALTIVKDFEMKSKFDLVLEELRMFHEISKENEILNTAETNNGQENYSGENNNIEEVKMKIKEDLKMGTVNKICTSSFHCDNRVASSLHKRHQSLFKWKVVPEKGEQEVPEEYYSPRTSEQELFYPTEEVGANSSAKRPALVSNELNEEKFHHSFKGGSSFSNGISRVLPLKTCSRPIRIGLSRKAKLKQLHPYLK